MTSATVHFSADHLTAAGHFPGHPMIPGAVLLDEMLHAFNPSAGQPLTIKSAKFFRPVTPGESVTINWQSPKPGAVNFEIHLAKDHTLIASGQFETGE